MKTALLIVLMAAVALAQSASEWDSHAVNAIAAKLQCSMVKGSTCTCKQDIACTMPPYPCPFCRMNKVRIFNMLNQGMTEQQILDAFVQESGVDVLTVHPGASANLGPWAAAIAGLLLVIVVIRRYRARSVAAAASATAGAPVDPEILDQIEKDLKKLDE